jgi:hypothetical protein
LDGDSVVWESRWAVIGHGDVEEFAPAEAFGVYPFVFVFLVLEVPGKNDGEGGRGTFDG